MPIQPLFIAEVKRRLCALGVVERFEKRRSRFRHLDPSRRFLLGVAPQQGADSSDDTTGDTDFLEDHPMALPVVSCRSLNFASQLTTFGFRRRTCKSHRRNDEIQMTKEIRNSKPERIATFLNRIVTFGLRHSFDI